MKKSYLLLTYVFLTCYQLFATTSSPQFVNGTDTLVVYNSIPNLPEFMPRVEAAETKDIRVISDKFTIRVRSAATNNEWIDVLALYTYNRALEIPDMNMLSGNPGSNSSTSVQHYPNATAGWSNTYGNIEMSKNQPVEVEIAAKNGFKIGGQNFLKATVHPAYKASKDTVIDGKVYFTISNPAQVAIDINGQMDDYNAFINPIGLPNDGVSSKTIPLHTITFFANPVIKKPELNDSKTFYVVDGKMPTVSPDTYDVLYFMPGVHDIGMGNKIYPGKSVYIPGDAIIFGTITNKDIALPSGFSKVGERIKIFGYGTISGARFKHNYYVTTNDIREPIHIDQGLDYQITGVTIVDGAHFMLWQPSGSGGFISYVKLIGWRANGDGIGNGDNVNDCFVRTNDDCSYVRGNRKRVTYWKDNISAIFYMSQIWETTPILIEDIDILYCRSRGGGGAAWDMRGDAPSGQRPAQVTFRNIRFHDTRANMTIFNLDACEGTSGGSYNWIKYENISIAAYIGSSKQNLLGCTAAAWNGGLTFENVSFAGTKLTASNFATYFNTNQYVNNINFKSTDYFTLTANADPTKGYVEKMPIGVTVSSQIVPYLTGTTVRYRAAPRPGYKFVNWSGDVSGTNPLNMAGIVMNANKTITANFASTNTAVVAPNSANDLIQVYPNPVKNKLHFKSNNIQIEKIDLIDMTNKLVYSIKNNLNNGSIDTSGYANGIYILKIHTTSNIISKKISIE